jgi:hypothetical protein
MKKLTLLVMAVCTVTILATSINADEHVHGYYKKDGTYVAPYERTSPNGTTSDNYSHTGNVNPYTGKPGDKNN